MTMDDIEEIPTFDSESLQESSSGARLQDKSEDDEKLAQSLKKHRMRWNKAVNLMF